MGWLRWKLDAKRPRSMGKLLRACPEAAVQATAIDDLHRERDARLVEITQKPKAVRWTSASFAGGKGRSVASF